LIRSQAQTKVQCGSYSIQHNNKYLNVKINKNKNKEYHFLFLPFCAKANKNCNGKIKNRTLCTSPVCQNTFEDHSIVLCAEARG
jgi:hypothetical protein